MMKYVMLVIWALVLGQVLSYLVSALAGTPFALINGLWVALAVAIAVIVIQALIPKKKKA
jgi:hypothetical protein